MSFEISVILKEKCILIQYSLELRTNEKGCVFSVSFYSLSEFFTHNVNMIKEIIFAPNINVFYTKCACRVVPAMEGHPNIQGNVALHCRWLLVAVPNT